MSEMNRREFLGVAVVSAACFCEMSCQENSPISTATVVDVGTVNDFVEEGASGRFAKSHGIIMVRRGERLYALSGICTHRGGILAPAGAELRCPRHGARFSLDGLVLKGPAERELVRFGIKLDENGQVIVDKTRSFGPEQANLPGSFLAV